MKEEIVKLCSEIRSNNKCSGCGGDFDNHTCKYCWSNSQELELLIGKLNAKLVNLNSYDFDILNALYSIKEMNIKIVNDFIQKYNFEEDLKGRYNDILNMVSKDVCGKYAYRQLIYFIDNNLFVGDNRNDLINFLMRKLLTFELSELDIQDMLNLIKMFTVMFMEGKVTNPKCIYEKLDEEVRGEAFLNIISLDKDSIIEMVEVGDFEGILYLVFRESTHTTQNYLRSSNKIGYNILIQVKEKILRSIVPGYYKDNYGSYNAEVEARFFGAYFTIQYLNSLGLEVLNIDYFKGIMEAEYSYAFYAKRTINGVETTVDEAFSMYVTDAKYLDMFPVLNVQYKNNNGKIEPKSREEILCDYERYKSGELSLNGEVEDIQILYDYLLSGYKSKENGI